jgi:hypothetical protein
MYCALGSQCWTYNLQKFFLGSYIHLLVQQIFLCIGITYLSSFLLALLRSTLSSNYALAFRLGQNLLNIPKFMLLKHKFSLILLLSKHKALPFFGSYLFSSDQIYFLAQSFANQVEYCTLQQHIYAQSFSFLFFNSQQS